ncbi:YdcF family protein [Falsiroseomonas selenitidurans]|uniref:YdcF family protein n=1 Tax=Falsiroseomonas selenitidurans TaxID=2716335 RepID=A0ABX1E4U5_9PROT|nr:YdcF family protein [Falsiroseomonas selenitidurans]NKC31740.1 YdcF family protein [Falsiroseomonas selenitidurans]
MSRTLLAELLLPPTGLALAALLALLLPRIGRALAACLLVLLLLLGMPVVSQPLLASLDPPRPAAAAAAQAIVILSGDIIRNPPAAPQPGPLTLDRLRAGAALARESGLPVLLTGGLLPPATTSLAAMMARSLRDDFRLAPRWLEEASRNTWENAALSAPLLHEAGIARVLVVTHAWHMRRALLAFRRAGLDPIAAPVRPSPWPDWTLGAFVPRASGWRDSYFALHEWLGLAYYRLWATST